MTIRLLISTVLAALIVGCVSDRVVRESTFQGDFTRYHCESQYAFQVAYMPNTPAALLRLVDGDYRLIQVPSGSGVKYTLDDMTNQAPNPITLHAKGNQARLEIGRMVYSDCLTQ
ncbi:MULTISPECIES: MliC family protein [Vibrio]|uniref:MliC family protein n=1 Tax=Vibrio TaxID=662 RepID=UPI000570D6BE|nr:MliC family protein [Vibrio pacinii]